VLLQKVHSGNNFDAVHFTSSGVKQSLGFSLVVGDFELDFLNLLFVGSGPLSKILGFCLDLRKALFRTLLLRGC
jgi:hypothetical protein